MPTPVPAIVALCVVVAAGAASADVRSRAESPTLVRVARSVPMQGSLVVDGLVVGGAKLSLSLTRFSVFAESSTIVVHGDGGETVSPPPDNAYFSGFVVGDPETSAFASFREDGTMSGMLAKNGRAWTLARGATGGMVSHRVDDVPESVSCGNAGHPMDSPASLRSVESAVPDAAAGATIYEATVAIETDHELWQIFGSSANVQNYLGDLFGYISTLYQNEIGTKIKIGYVSLWETASDPWTEPTSHCVLRQFGHYWNLNRTGVTRTFSFFHGGRSLGGVAWRGVLCEGPYAVSGNASCNPPYNGAGAWAADYGLHSSSARSFDPNDPMPVTSVYGTAHEIGHQFLSRHTHCYAGNGGVSSEVDRCYSGESGCWNGAETLPGPGSVTGGTSGSGNGTIMSYCGTLGADNLTLSFGTGHPYGVSPQRVPDTMRSFVVSVASANPACLPVAAPSGSRIGLYDPSNAAFFLRNAFASGPADSTFYFGAAGQGLEALSGDWDGNGTATPGLYHPASGAFFLRNSASNGPADHTFYFGPGGGLIPVVGEWDGNGTETVGLYDPSNGAFFLRNAHSNGPADLTFYFGPGTLTPIVGDWNADGTDSISLYDTTNGAFFLTNTNGSGPASSTFYFGSGGRVPMTGDWNDSGQDTIGLYDGSSGAFFLRNLNGSGPADHTFFFGPGGQSWTPLSGEWP